MTKRYDVIVIGSGPAAMSAVYPIKESGKSVAVVEAAHFGGTCPNTGCDPKKILYAKAEAAWQAKQLAGKGVSGEVSFNWEEAMTEKEKYTSVVPDAMEKKMNEAGIDTYHGFAEFQDEATIGVGDQTLTADRFLIATGAKPMAFDFEGAHLLKTSEDFLAQKSMPETIALLGGGYISFECAHLAARAGADVHIIEAGDQALKAFNQTHVKELIQLSEELGITFHWNWNVERVEETSSGVVISAGSNQLKVDALFHGAGRVPNIEKLQLDKAGVKTDKGGIVVNEYLQSTSNSRVFAAGDVASTDTLPLTPLSGKEGAFVAENLIANEMSTWRPIKAMPSIVFTIPKLAQVGKSEGELKKAGVDFESKEVDMTDWLSNKASEEPIALANVLIEKSNGTILGAHFLSQEADQWINVFSMAIQLGITVDQLKSVQYLYPTVLGDMGNLF
ncbi:glutathione reductase (NADPH) [Alkalihalobacillus xiaoxiensis]|uniref:Glutathione reductase (NADPH) n=1 Tax=Shouchella xiaoxiensis TaxID=766895 RepID=A0ABS2SRR6_9BACI|nr:NAD(P)/FAD-dependent oxidoreductase [Shouchella xiaoxiensis]MBM7837856.1 glutathione reductase (NADPH) [Shouchella xiaoxiensis]